MSSLPANSSRHPARLRAAGRCWFLLCAILLFTNSIPAQQPAPATQIIELEPGWNLISIQTGTGVTPAQFQASLGVADAGKLRSIWGYGTATAPGTAAWQWKFHRTDPGHPNDLLLLEPGKGYWVDVAGFCQATITGIPWDSAVSLNAGWNLVGFPGLTRNEAELQEVASVFGDSFDRITQVWGWDAGAAQRFKGYDVASVPNVRELPGLEPGKGYWVYSMEPVTLTPVPSLILPPDADLTPAAPEILFSAADARWHGINPATYVGTPIRWAGAEDAEFDLNSNGVLDSPFTQDTIIFYPGVDRKVITVANRGSGAFNWAMQNAIPWLFTTQADEKAYPGNTGRSNTAQGTVSSETDAIELHVDTRGLQPGRQTAAFTMRLGSQTRQVRVILEVPTSNGDWKGYATTRKVNGRTTPIGAVDMGLNLFMDEGSPLRFKAVLNKDSSLLFPRDVFMNGVFYSGNLFSMTTNFEMPAGDRNAPPFNTFRKPSNYDSLTGAARLRADYDANGDGITDVSNPFGFAIHREITLQGTRVNPNRMEGNYVETITGILPDNQGITIEGTFFLDRQTYQPTRRSIFNQASSSAAVSIGGTSGQLYREMSINVGSAVSISGASLGLTAAFPDPKKLTITLIGPTGQQYVIHNGSPTLPSKLDLTAFNGTSGKGTWKLRVAWSSTPERGTFGGWTLDLQGLATYQVSGRVMFASGMTGLSPLAGATVVLSGSNLIEARETGPDGSFSMNGLTENNYTVSISRAGFQSRSFSFFLTNSDLYVGQNGAGTSATLLNAAQAIRMEELTSPDSIISAGPWIGQEPLQTTLTAVLGHDDSLTLLPAGDDDALAGGLTSVWNFGDGSPPVADTASPTDQVSLTMAKYNYIAPGTFTPSVTFTSIRATVTVTGQTIHVVRGQPMTGPDAPTRQVLAVSFTGSIASPPTNSAALAVTSPATIASYDITNDGAAPLAAVAAGIVYQESKRDTAGFDVDRFPLITTPDAADFNPAAEDTDFLAEFSGVPGPIYISGNGSVTTPFALRGYDPAQDPAYDFTPAAWLAFPPPAEPGAPALESNRFRLFTTMGGYVFATQPAMAGDLVLQAGRMQP